MALVSIRGWLRRRAARNDVKRLLDEVAERSEALAHTLSELHDGPDAAHGEALRVIEEGYWHDHPEDDGAMVAHHLLPRLATLATVARAGVKSGAPTRHRTSDPRPIARIETALIAGWTKRHGPKVVTFWGDPSDENITAMIEDAKANPPGKPYPGRFRPSVSESAVFRDIVGICYAAAGYSAFPKRALEAYVKMENKHRREILREVQRTLNGEDNQ